MLHAVSHALRACRGVLQQLALDGVSTSVLRARVLRDVLAELVVPSPAAPVGSALCACALSAVCTLDSRSLIPKDEPLELVRLCLAALTAQEYSSDCRRDLRLILVTLLSQAREAEGTSQQDHRAAALRRGTSALLDGASAQMAQRLASDVRHGSPSERCAALALMSVMASWVSRADAGTDQARASAAVF